jgi:hypothetical protein
MNPDYDKVYETAFVGFDMIYSKKGNYPRDTILSDEDKILEPLRELEAYLSKSEDLKYACRTAMRIIDALDVNYWSDINEKSWIALCLGIDKLRNPESITREGKQNLSKTIISNGLSMWPQQTPKTEKRGNYKDNSGKSICQFICKEAGLKED